MTEEQAVAGIKWATREITALRAKVASLQAAQSASHSLPTEEVTDAMRDAGVKSMRWQKNAPRSTDKEMVRGIYHAMEAARIPAAPDDAVVFVALKLLDAGGTLSPGQVQAIRAALSAIPIPAPTGGVERLGEALRKIAALNDLSAAPEDEIEAWARGNLYECELIAIAALTDHTTKDDLTEQGEK